MTQIVIFHHVLGLTPGVLRLAVLLRNAGHTAITPDLFEGESFSDLESGLAYVDALGHDQLLQRAERAVADPPVAITYAGLSLGALPAQHLLQTRPGAEGGILLHSFVDPDYLKGTWPEACPVHVFAMDNDPFFVDDGDLEAARTWQRTHDNLRFHLYPGDGHLFTEPSSPDYDAEATRTLIADVLRALP